MPPFKTVFSADEIDEALAGFRDVLTSGRLILGPHTKAFEEGFAQLVQGRHTVAVNSGSTALEVLLHTNGVAGRDVLVPSNTNFATARAVLAAGGRPVLFDCGLWPNAEQVRDRLTSATAAVIVVHIGGHVSPEMPKIAAELGQSGIALIEDCAHAHGSTLDGAPAGTFGHAAFSFFPTKVITTFEGGMTVTADPAVAASARSYRDQGKDGSGDYHVVLGNSWRLTKAGAVLGLVQLKWFEDGLARRTEIMNRYRESLGGVLRFPDLGPRDILSGHKAIAFSGKEISREQWRSCAAAGGVSLARDVYAIPLHRQPVFASYAVAGDTFAETDHFCDTHQCLPLWTAMTDAEVARVIDVIGSIAA